MIMTFNHHVGSEQNVDFADILNQISVWILSSVTGAAPDEQVAGFNWMSVKDGA